MGLFSKREEEIIGVLEISSGHVSGAIMIKDAHGMPLILASSRKEYAFTHDRDAHRLQKDMSSLLSLVCEDLQKKTLARPSRIYVALSSPWSYGEIRSIHLNKEKEFMFTQVMAMKLVAEEALRFEKEHPENTQIIDKKIVHVRLNGYTVHKPHGQKIRRAEIDVFMSFVPGALLRMMEDVIHRTYKTRISFTSSMACDFIFVRDMLPSGEDFLTISIHEEMTELTAIKSGTVSSTAFLPLGTRSSIRNLAAELHTSLHEGHSLARMHAEGVLDEHLNTDAVSAVEAASLAWRTALKRVLLEMLPTRHMPSHIVVIADESLGAWLAQQIRQKFFPEFTTSHGEFDVIIYDIKTLHQFFRAAEGVRVESGIITKSIFINRI